MFIHFSVYVNTIQKNSVISNLIFTLLTPVRGILLLSYTFNGSHYFRSDFIPSVRICWCPRAAVGDRTRQNPDTALSVHRGCSSQWGWWYWAVTGGLGGNRSQWGWRCWAVTGGWGRPGRPGRSLASRMALAAVLCGRGWV